MSEKNKKSTLDLKNIFKKSIISILIMSVLLVILSAVFALLLKETGRPEIFYKYSGYLILAISSFLVGKFYIKNSHSDKSQVLIFTTVLLTILISILSVAISGGQTSLLPIIIKAFIIFIFFIFGSSSGKKKKRKNKVYKRR